MNAEQHVPPFRFKGFSDFWEQRKLSDLAMFNPRLELPDSFQYVDLESVSGTELINHRTETKSSAPSRAQRLQKKAISSIKQFVHIRRITISMRNRMMIMYSQPGMRSFGLMRMDIFSLVDCKKTALSPQCWTIVRVPAIQL